VDDGEDAAVIVHEYGHVLCQASIAFGNSGLERRSVEEGICDYLAGSYVRKQSDFQWTNLFKWDGHNEFWPGRTLNSPKIYPDNLVGQIHKDGEIFSSVLTTMETILGREITHKVLFTSLPYLLPNFTMPQAAQAIMDSDSAMYNGTHSALIRQLFQAKGIQPGFIIVSAPTALAMADWNIQTLQSDDGWILTKPEKKPGEAFLTDQKGRVLQSYELPSGQNRIKITSGGLLPGLYFLRVQSGNDSKTVKLITYH
jgi:hypothetical protein